MGLENLSSTRLATALGNTDCMLIAVGGDSAVISKIAMSTMRGVAVADLTDNSTGSASDTIAAGSGKHTLYHPLTSLATGLSTAAIDILTDYTLGYKFKLTLFSFATTLAGTGSSASQVFNLEIVTTNVTGGVLTLALADTAAIGQIKAATAISAANTGTAAQAFSIEMAASGTVFTAGAGYFIVGVQNMDTADAIASLSAKIDALLASLRTPVIIAT